MKIDRKNLPDEKNKIKKDAPKRQFCDFTTENVFRFWSEKNGRN
ncbi:hypothetical protein GCM10022393_19790 [Aquimarina addita]|uniref:Uncharacterized protein n=1 Tax=Aquimarina addita TaxID=870485 RepID=A0ABP6UI30_9FLAO